jgi:hypothetical protein
VKASGKMNMPIRGFACFVTGDELTGKLILHRISPALEASEITLLP